LKNSITVAVKFIFPPPFSPKADALGCAYIALSGFVSLLSFFPQG
jgi:hypothetical protein